MATTISSPRTSNPLLRMLLRTLWLRKPLPKNLLPRKCPPKLALTKLPKPPPSWSRTTTSLQKQISPPDAMENANIYLTHFSDGTYNACVAKVPPIPESVFLLKEGRYPTELYCHRYDIMGDRIVGRDIYEDRDDLISCVNWHGICLHRIVSLWELETQPCDDKLTVLFASAYAKHCEMAPPLEYLN